VIPVFGREIVEREQRSTSLVRHVTAGAYFSPYFCLNVSIAATASARVSEWWMF
jgi:hypothetical protein